MTAEEYLANVREHKNVLIEKLNYFLNDTLPQDLVLFGQLLLKFLLLIVIYIVLDVFFRRLLLPLIKKYARTHDSEVVQLLLKYKVFNSLISFIVIYITYQCIPYIFYNHPKSFGFLDKIFYISLFLTFMQFASRVISVIEDLSMKNMDYKSVAMRSFGQLIRLIGLIVGTLVIISILFNINSSQILTTIGAITAVILLIFRDPILGFVAGIHAANSKMVKEGDWVYIQKYDLEGVIKEINLISVKIEGFDKTISTIPTYDLISTELKNHDAMVKGNRRQVKRSIFLNINTFKFLKDEEIERFSRVSLLSHYITEKTKEIETHNQKAWVEPQMYERQLTNIGLYRIYIYEYLKANPYISKQDTLIVKQLEVSTQGLPIEIFCFTNTSKTIEYEAIQADIFDYLLTSAKEFDLEVIQVKSL